MGLDNGGVVGRRVSLKSHAALNLGIEKSSPEGHGEGGSRLRDEQGVECLRSQSLTTVCLVPPTCHVGTRLLANDGISTEDAASEFLFFFGLPTSAHIRHTMPGVGGEGGVGVLLEREAKRSQPS